MRKKIFAIRDNKVSDYKYIHIEDNEIMAARGLRISLEQNESMVAKFPEDHELFLLGEVDTITGVIQPELPPKLIMSCIALKKMNEKKVSN